MNMHKPNNYTQQVK